MPPGGSSGGPVTPAALVDTHVHFHDCFELLAFLEAASDNLARAERTLGCDHDPEGAPAHVLLVMETGGQTLITRLAAAGDQLARDGWHLETRGDSARLDHPERRSLYLVEGRQVVTAERLELLTTPGTAELASGRSLDDTLAEAAARQSISILPWGFGKWSGRRGRLIAGILESGSPGRLLLADNGGRLKASWKPRLLTLGAQRGFAVVRGSDPLPLPSDVGRVGSSGSLVHGPFDAADPAASVRRLLGSLQFPPRSFGHGVGPWTFLTHQIRMQLRRRPA